MTSEKEEVRPDASISSEQLRELGETAVVAEPGVQASPAQPSCEGATQYYNSPEYRRMRAVHTYAWRQDYHPFETFTGGWPTFEETDTLYGCCFTTAPDGETGWIKLPWGSLGDAEPNPTRLSYLWRAVNRWAFHAGYATAFPVCTSFADQDVVIRTWRRGLPYMHYAEIPLNRLPDQPNFDDAAACIRNVNRYAYDLGFAAAFPNFEMAQYDDSRGVVYGAFLFSRPAPLICKDVPRYLLRQLGAD